MNKEFFGKYRVTGTLGKGAMGVVYEAIDPTIDRPVAIKALHNHLIEDESGEDFLVRFRQEAKAAARCLHQNIVAVFDYGISEDKTPYIVMELVQGQELKNLLNDLTPYSIAQTLHIIGQVLDALDFAHNQGVIHRDIKPANIMVVDDTLQVKVTDFGVAHIDTSDLTGTGYILGTPAYMSPEAFYGKKVDVTSDVYSVGIVLYELLSGFRAKFDDGRPAEQHVQDILEEVMHPHPMREALIRILRRALQVKPEDRYTNAHEFREALRQAEGLSEESSNNYSETIIVRTAIESPAAAHKPADSSTNLTASMSGDSVVMVEKRLASYIGPLAKILVKKGLKKSQSLADFSHELASHIPVENERNKFLQDMSAISQTVSQTSMASNISGMTRVKPRLKRSIWDEMDEDNFKKLADIYSFYTGAIAKKLIKVTAQKNSNFDEFISDLANNIPNESERKDFDKAIKRAGFTL